MSLKYFLNTKLFCILVRELSWAWKNWASTCQKNYYLIVTLSKKTLHNHLIKSWSSLFNCYLKEIAELCNINKTITCHVARHSFATLCLTEGVPIESVSKMLGHTDIRTTQIYARIIDQKLSNDMDILALKLNKKEGDVKKIG